MEPQPLYYAEGKVVFMRTGASFGTAICRMEKAVCSMEEAGGATHVARLMNRGEVFPTLLSVCKALHALLSKLDVHGDAAELRDAEAAIRKAEGLS